MVVMFGKITVVLHLNFQQNPSLPDDLILSIIARVSRLYYPTLSLVSKSFRSLLTSLELYKTRSLLGHTESCLYVCFKTSTCCWFTLCRKPDQTLTNDHKKKSGYVLGKVPIPHSPDADFSGLVAVGSNIYNIGNSQSHFKASSSTVFVLDCMTHTWREAPRLPEKLFSVSANVLDGKIYVAGRSAISADGDNDSHCMLSASHCEIDNVLYCFSHGAFRWYDSQVGFWKDLKGLVGLPKFPHDDCVRLVDYDGKMVVFWVERTHYAFPPYGNMIWCAEIALERRKSGEIWGKVEWFDHVLTVPLSHNLVKAVVATV